MSQENSEQLLNTGNTSALKRKFFEAGSSRSSSLNPSQARVFDVYNNNTDSPHNLQLLDIFSDELKTKPLNDVALNETASTELKTNDSGLREIEEMGLLNDGKGAKPGELQTNVFADPKKRKVSGEIDSGVSDASGALNGLDTGENVPVSNSRLLKSPRNNITTTHAGAQVNASPRMAPAGHQNSLYMKDGYDKWPNNVEDAFIRGLRLVMKNGTSKIKLREKNYGRNELISLYIQYFTGEFRTKKQISSHIQVWKKAILNKVTNNIQLTPMDQELLTLIEEGAPQTEKTTRLFYETFETILSQSSTEKSGAGTGGVHFQRNTMMNLPGAGTSLPMKTSHSGPVYPTYMSSGSGGAYPALTPKSGHAVNSMSGYGGPLDGPAGFSAGMNTYPITPMDYAKSIYENMKSYKCVPAKLEDDTYSSFLRDMPSGSNSGGNKNSSSDSLLLSGNAASGGGGSMSRSNTRMSSNMTSSGALASAKKIEAEQRRMIEELNRKSKSNSGNINGLGNGAAGGAGGLDFGGLDDRSVSNNSFYDRLPFVQEDLPLGRSKDWSDVGAPLYMTQGHQQLQQQQQQQQAMGSTQRSVSGSSIGFAPDAHPQYIQALATAPTAMYPNQYLVPMPQPMPQTIPGQSGRTMSKQPGQSPFVSYAPVQPQQSQQQGGATMASAHSHQTPPSSAMYYYNPRQAYMQSSNGGGGRGGSNGSGFPVGPFKSNQSVSNSDLPFEQFHGGNQDYS